MGHLRIVGDVHGHFMRYAEKISRFKYSLQIGDMGLDYPKLWTGEYQAPRDMSEYYNNHKFFGGNHDNYDKYYNCSNALGDYGHVFLGNFRAFYIRGAFSIDKKYRVDHQFKSGNKIWWKQEQLTYSMLQDAIDMYSETKPDIMVSHTCPTEASKIIGNPDVLRDFGFDPNAFRTDTQEALQRCFDAHQPKLWIFGHFHQDRAFYHGGTTFVCLNELSCLDIDETGRILTHPIDIKVW